MYLVLRHVGGSRDSSTCCALVGVSRYNFTNVYFCIMFLYLYRINKFLPSFLPSYIAVVANSLNIFDTVLMVLNIVTSDCKVKFMM